MKSQTFAILVSLALPFAHAAGQVVLFDFDNAPAYTPLPINLTVGGITANFSSSGLGGYSIQAANTYGFIPIGFAGNCLYPSGIDAADLHIAFSQSMTDFSILYAPHELACDSSATMRVTALLNGAMVGTATTNAAAGTWPSETLRVSSTQGFNSLIVHYDAPPITGGDYGTIFMADNMSVTPAAPPILLGNAIKLPGGAFQFDFNYTPGTPFRVFATTDPSTQFSSWTLMGSPTEVSSGSFQYTDNQAATAQRKFYRVSTP